MIAGLQAAFLLFHNRVVDKLRETATTSRRRRPRTILPEPRSDGDATCSPRRGGW